MTQDTAIAASPGQALEQALQEVHALVPPLWPLSDYVAVNPCMGMIDRPLLGAHQLMSHVRSCQLLMPGRYYRALFSEGRLTRDDLEAALAQCREEHPEWYRDFELAELLDWLSSPVLPAPEKEIRFRTVAETVDERQGSTWSSHIVNDITRHCAAHYDEGQAAWRSPWKDASLYAAWRQAAQLGRRMEYLGLREFRGVAAKLPADPQDAIEELLRALHVPPSHWGAYLLCQAFSVAGWASYIRYHVREAELAGGQNDDLVGLLAIRLAYDVALSRTVGAFQGLSMWPSDADLEEGRVVPPAPTNDAIARYALQVATEQMYRTELLHKLGARSVTQARSARKAMQIVFCIDVRSEVMRRNLETVHHSIETFGFAGFFGMPLEYVPLGFSKGTAQCPVLLQPSFQVHERLRGIADPVQDRITKKRLAIRRLRGLWKSFQGSAISCFSFVESLGMASIGKLLVDTLRWSRGGSSADQDAVPESLLPNLGPDLHSHPDRGLSAIRRIDLAEGMLRNLGLAKGLARVVVLCGHASDVTNNPYRAALDCGACGGHSGEPNARVAAALLNDEAVRLGLAARGIVIPPDTWFVAAVHNTTADTVKLCDGHLVPDSHAEDVRQIERWLEEAGQLSRMERAPRLGSKSVEDVLRRSRDWSEVRPEWGLAGNAAFIVASRSRTSGLELGGRTFLHSYEHQNDPQLKVLELIMTAPMVVTNWINMQYYASTVDPVSFGSGNKVIHNVVGQFGVLQGNGGDLMTGLPWQSIHDGQRLQHEPLRLLVVIDAPRSSIQQIIGKHALVRDLVTNGWISLISWESDQFYRWTARGTWEVQPR